MQDVRLRKGTGGARFLHRFHDSNGNFLEVSDLRTVVRHVRGQAHLGRIQFLAQFVLGDYVGIGRPNFGGVQAASKSLIVGEETGKSVGSHHLSVVVSIVVAQVLEHGIDGGMGERGNVTLLRRKTNPQLIDDWTAEVSHLDQTLASQLQVILDVLPQHLRGHLEIFVGVRSGVLGALRVQTLDEREALFFLNLIRSLRQPACKQLKSLQLQDTSHGTKCVCALII